MALHSTIWSIMKTAQQNVISLGERILYKAFETYYALRELAVTAASASKEPASKPLRNPIHRLVEFYVDHIWSGNLEEAYDLRVDNEIANGENLESAIYQIWEWSNWEAKKATAIRQFALKGDLFLKIVARPPLFADVDTQPDRVTFQIIDPANVSEFDVDDRQIVTFMRLDIPSERRNADDELESYTHTEVWNSEGMRLWEHDKGEAADINLLGTPKTTMTLKEAGVEGMLPFVRAPFRDTGQKRGHNCFWASIEKIDEASNIATRLHRDLFRTGPLWALENQGRDSDGRPLAPPRVSGEAVGTSTEIDLSGEKFLSVSGSLKCLIPPVDFEGMLKILQAQQQEILEDLPELQYYRVVDQSRQVATATIRLFLAPAITRVKEARANADYALIRADQIALIMAQNLDFPGFKPGEIGTYDNGDFEHSFGEREILPETAEEHAETEKLQADADLAKRELGIPWKIIMQERGYTEEEIEEFALLLKEEQTERRTAADAMMEEAMRRFSQGGQEEV